MEFFFGKGRNMHGIQIERHPSPERLSALGVWDWPIWEKEASEFPWTYDSTEVAYFMDGQVIVTPDGGEPLHMGKGDLVIFPSGLKCVWNITEPVRKHFNFE